MKVRIVEAASTYWKYAWRVEVKHWFYGWQLKYEFGSNQEDTKPRALEYARKLKNRVIEEVV